MVHKQIIGFLVKNYTGVLQRVTSLFTRRGFNIDSLTVSPTSIDGYSRITVRILGDDEQLSQFINQMMKLHDVKKVEVLPEKSSVISELIFIKVKITGEDRNRILTTVSSYHASVVDLGETTATFRASGLPSEIDELISRMEPFGIMELVRTGAIALHSGDECMVDGLTLD